MDDGSFQRVHERIDALARDVHTLQLTTVQREGPLVSEIREYQRKVDRLNDGVLKRDEFRKGMETFRKELENDDYRTFNKRDRLWAGALALATVSLQIVSVIILISSGK